MNLENLKTAILSINPDFDDDALNDGLSKFLQRDVKARDLILEPKKVCDHLFFAPDSIVRCFYFNAEGEEHTLWMKPEGSLITEYKSYVSGKSSGFGLQCYEDTVLFQISRKDLFELYKTYSDWAVFGINLTEAVHVSLIDVFVNLLSNDATRNYQYIAYAFPRFIQVAPLKDIASMLQISPVSLSRIRSGTQTKA